MINLNESLGEISGFIETLKYKTYPQSYYAESVNDFLNDKENNEIKITSYKRALLHSIFNGSKLLARKDTATIIVMDVQYQRLNENEAIIQDTWDEGGLEQHIIQIASPEKRHQLDLEQGMDIGKWYKVSNVSFIHIPKADASVLLNVNRYDVGPDMPDKVNLTEFSKAYGL